MTWWAGGNSKLPLGPQAREANRPGRRPLGQTRAGVGPAPSQSVLFARQVIISGAGEGWFIYNGTPGPGNPPVAYGTAAGVTKDPFGNALPGLPTAAGSIVATGPGELIQMADGALFLEAQPVAAGAQAASIATGGIAGFLEIGSGTESAADTTASIMLLNSGARGGTLTVQSGADGNTYDTMRLSLIQVNDVSINSTTPVTLFSAPVAIGTYEINAWMVCSNVTAADPASFAFTGPAAATKPQLLDFKATSSGSGATTDYAASSTYTAAFSGGAFTGNQETTIRATVKFTAAGTLALTAAETVAGNAITVFGGARLDLMPVTGLAGSGGSGGGGLGSGFLQPSGDITGATDFANITAALAVAAAIPGGAVLLAPGLFHVNQKITVPAYSGLQGNGIRPMGTQFDWAGFTIAGTILQATSTFTGTALLEFSNTTANETGGQTLRNLAVDMHLAPGGYGVHSTGSIAAVTIEDILIYHGPSTGLLIELGLGGGQGPDTWFVSGLKVSHCVVGISTVAADTWWLNCESSENTSSGWVVSGTGNARYIGCKSENNGGYGWFVTTGATSPVHWDACTTQFNTLSGFKFTGPDGAANPSVHTLTNCRSAFDAGKSGLEVDACLAWINAIGFTTLTISNTTPLYGASIADSSNLLSLTSCFLQGNTAATLDDGSNTHALINNLPLPT